MITACAGFVCRVTGFRAGRIPAGNIDQIMAELGNAFPESAFILTVNTSRIIALKDVVAVVGAGRILMFNEFKVVVQLGDGSSAPQTEQI